VLGDPIERGPGPEWPWLFVIDGAKVGGALSGGILGHPRAGAAP